MASEDKSEMGEEETKMKCLHCGKKAVERVVQTEGANKDKKYFKCGNPIKPECSKFFKWAEQLQVGAEGDAILCLCKDLAVKEVVKKEGKNKGRVFYHCGKLKAFQCKFWEWEPVKVDESVSSGMKCKCDVEAKREVVKKEGKNKGRVFYHCSKPKVDNCKFWQWGKKEEWEHPEEAMSKNDEDKKGTKRANSEKELDNSKTTNKVLKM